MHPGMEAPRCYWGEHRSAICCSYFPSFCKSNHNGWDGAPVRPASFGGGPHRFTYPGCPPEFRGRGREGPVQSGSRVPAAAGAGGPGAALGQSGPPNHSQALVKVQAGGVGPGPSCCLRCKPQRGEKVRGFRASSEGPARPRRPVPADSGACGPDGCSVEVRPNVGPGGLRFRTAPS